MQLTITNLSKKFGDFTAIDNLNVTMTTGVYGLLGGVNEQEKQH